MPLVPFHAPLPVTDGVASAAWQDVAAVDTSPPASRRLHALADTTAIGDAATLAPSPCDLAATDGTRLALDCGEASAADVRLREIAGDVETTPAGNAAINAFLLHDYDGADESYRVTALGRALVEVTVAGRIGALPLLFDLSTGALRRRRPFGSTERRSLDVSAGATRLCTPLRVTRHRERDPFGEGTDPVPDASAFAAGRLLRRHGGELRLSRCGRRGSMVIGRSSRVPPVLTARYAAWTTRTHLVVRVLRSGRTSRYRLAAPRSTQPFALAGTARRLWVEDARGVHLLEP